MKVYVLPCSATTLVEDSQESRLSSFWIRPEVRSILLRPITRPLSDLSVNVPVQFMYVISFWFRRFRTIAADGASKDCPRCLSMDMHKSQISELGREAGPTTPPLQARSMNRERPGYYLVLSLARVTVSRGPAVRLYHSPYDSLSCPPGQLSPVCHNGDIASRVQYTPPCGFCDEIPFCTEVNRGRGSFKHSRTSHHSRRLY
ncbi:Uncharacterized protein HZ326_5071 [Fusarium oxysporum f. sp. albedinis]|nr:Uncharacterized protein HZ326_5071 [Fusarium oxysporum f. sp. albedinis]